MKHLLKLIFLTFYISNAANAQPIVSLGELKIGMTEIEFLELPEVKSKTIQDIGNKKNDLNDNVVWKKTADSTIPDSFSRRPELWKIHTPEYIKYEFKMSTGVKDGMNKDLYKTTLEFYKNKLVLIDLDISGSFHTFVEILTKKYGKPVVVGKMKKEICQNGYGVKSEHDTGYTTSNWGLERDISGRLMLLNSECGKYPGAFYQITNKQGEAVKELERVAAQEAFNKANSEKSSSSKL